MTRKFQTLKNELFLAFVFTGMMQGKYLPLVLTAMGSLFIGGLPKLHKALLKKPIFLIAVYFIYLGANLSISNGIEQLVVIDFWRYDGKQIFTLCILVFSTAYFLVNKVLFKTVARALFIASIIIMPLAIAFGGTTHDLHIALYSSHNAAAGMSGAVCLVALSYLFAKPNDPNKATAGLAICAFVLSGIVFILAASRSFLVALTFVFVCKVFSSNTRIISKILIVLVIGTTGFIGLKYSGSIERLSPDNIQSDSNLWSRIFYWREALDYFRVSPFVGIGLGTFNDENVEIEELFPGLSVKIKSSPFYGENHAHNIILQLLAEVGLIGMIILSLAWLSLIKRKPIQYDAAYFYEYCTLKKTVNHLFIYVAIASSLGNNLLTPSTSFILYIFGALLVSQTLDKSVHNPRKQALYENAAPSRKS